MAGAKTPTLSTESEWAQQLEADARLRSWLSELELGSRPNLMRPEHLRREAHTERKVARLSAPMLSSPFELAPRPKAIRFVSLEEVPLLRLREHMQERPSRARKAWAALGQAFRRAKAAVAKRKGPEGV